MGSFSMLYNCDHIKVESNRKSFEAYTKDVLQQEEIQITNSAVQVGTVITLTGYCLSEATNQEDIYNRLTVLAKGFAIPVWFNGEEIERPHRLDAVLSGYRGVDSAIGKVWLYQAQCLEDSAARKGVFFRGIGTIQSQLYYQGLPVGADYMRHQNYNIIHLDESLFEVRMPDRDVLISHTEHVVTISDEVRRLWRQALTEAKAKLPEDVFVGKLYSTVRDWGFLDMLNDVETLPPSMVFRVTEAPFQERIYHDEEFSSSVDGITKSELDSKGVKLLQLQPNCNEESITEWTYAYHGEFLCFGSDDLDKGHWIFNNYLIQVDENNPISVSMTNYKGQKQFSGEWCWFNCYLGEFVEMDGPLGKVDKIDSCVFVSDEIAGHEQTGMFIPSGATQGSDIAMANSFNNNDCYDESAAQNEESLFGSFLLSVNSSTDEAIIKLLNDAGIAMLGLNNKSVKVTFDDHGRAVLAKAT